MIFQPAYSSLVTGDWSGSGNKVGTHPGQDAIPSQGRSHPHQHSLKLGQSTQAASFHTHIFGMWEETRAPGKHPHRHGENVQTLHSQWLQLGIHFFSHVIMI